MRNITLVALVSLMIVVGPLVAAAAPGGGGGGFSGMRGGPTFGAPSIKGGHFHGHNQLRASIPTRLFPHHRGFYNGFHGFYGQRFLYGQQFFPYGGGYAVYSPGIGYGYGYGYGYPAYGYASYGYAAPTYVVTAPVPPTPLYEPVSSGYGTAPMQGVVEFASGKYVLQADGSTYKWVWVPNPPTSPPGATTPAAAAAPREPVRPLDYYRWTDDEGVTHLSDRLDLVPDVYRSRARKWTTGA
jgi:hypothetical protein